MMEKMERPSTHPEEGEPWFQGFRYAKLRVLALRMGEDTSAHAVKRYGSESKREKERERENERVERENERVERKRKRERVRERKKEKEKKERELVSSDMS